MKIFYSLFLVLLVNNAFAQDYPLINKFSQLETLLPTPNVYRTASGAPGSEYWQQKVDYNISVVLDDKTQIITGSELITYTNNSPDELTYLWLQLDQNMRAQGSMTALTSNGSMEEKMTFNDLARMQSEFDGGFKIQQVQDLTGKNLDYTINNTMMRVDLPKPLKAGGMYSFKITWWYNINDRDKIGGRSGYEYFEKEDNYLYTIAQFFPRMCVYSDNQGWQHKQFLGRGEFTLPFGDYQVNITVPSDHIVAATGTLMNAKTALNATQRQRFEQARTAETPVMIVTEAEAKKAEASKATGTKTWTFHAKNVRDFAFASSRKFIWDAMGVNIGGVTVMAMSYYPKEGNPLWERYSTKVVAHTIKTYSKFTVDYNYPVAISVHAKSIGMEYPMICFNGGRPEPDGTYSAGTKHGMISVIIHEVGHNFFPMIINSDERQWTWMDEGLNTFVQYLTEQEWDRKYPSRRGPAANITDYMKGDKSNISPIMTNSESIKQFGNNAYGKPATALNILRETVMGRELFDYSFKEYCRRWAFKHPTPADFFRTMEDASAVDLDWFWRGWFYSTDHCDQALKSVEWFQIDTRNPQTENPLKKTAEENREKGISEIRNATSIAKTQVEIDSNLRDFYLTHDFYKTYPADKLDYERYLSILTEEQKALLQSGGNFYQLNFENIGGLVMPIILEFEFTDGTKEVHRIPVEIWRQNQQQITKIFITTKVISRIVLDPYLEVADCDRNNNYWPPMIQPTRFELFKKNGEIEKENPMQRMKRSIQIQNDVKTE